MNDTTSRSRNVDSPAAPAMSEVAPALSRFELPVVAATAALSSRSRRVPVRGVLVAFSHGDYC
jgi:hypothetical protein